MKLNLILHESDCRSGYTNCGPIARLGRGAVHSSFSHLDPLCEDAEATELIALDVIDFVSPGEINEMVAHWVRKLRHGGTLTVGGLDLAEVARRLVSGRLDHDAANLLIYGSQDVPALCRKACMPLRVACEVLEAYGLKVLTKTYNECFYVVTSRRP